MESKLTLKLNKDIIEEAKKYAKDNNISLSRIVENFFNTLVQKKTNDDSQYTPLVKELSGVIQLDKDYHFQEDYTDYLIAKYS